MWRPTGCRLAIDELGLAADTRGAQTTRQPFQPHGDDLAVTVPVLYRGILGDVDRPHPPG